MKMPRQIIEKTELLEILSASYLNDYKINVSFSNGKEVIVDFAPFLKNSMHPDILKYLDLALFKSFTIVDGNLNWNDYDMIFPVEDLYKNNVLHGVAEKIN